MIQQDNDRQDKAVSETIGFILMFGIVIISMSFIYMMGYPLLQSNMDTSVFESAEQSFIVIRSDMKMVAFEQVPIKVMKMKMHSSMLFFENSSSIVIRYDGNTLNYSTGSIRYIKDNDELIYENTAIMKSYSQGGDLMVSKPSIYSTSIDNINVTTLGVVQTRGEGSASGSAIVDLRMQHNSSSLIRTDGTTDVNVTINSDYAALWSDQLQQAGFTTSSLTDNSVTAYRNDTMLIIGHHLVDVELD